MGDHVRVADRVLAGGHVHIDELHGQPGHEDEEGHHGEHTADGRVVRRVVLIGETNWLAESIKFLEEVTAILLGHYI